jgi:hypothetical protein
VLNRSPFPVVALAAATAVACWQPSAPSAATPVHVRRTIAPSAQTGTERTAGRAPSTDSEVATFLDVLALQTGRTSKAGVTDSALGAAPLLVAAYDTGSTGKLIPVVIAARPRVLSATQAHEGGRPIIFVEAGAQPSAQDGTDAVLALLREILAEDPSAHARTPTLLDSIVLVVVPRARASAVDSTIPGPDTDLVLANAAETRTTLSLFHSWTPDVVIDLQSGDLGGGAYPLVVAPPLAPAAVLSGPFTADTLLRTLYLTPPPFPCGSIVPRYGSSVDDSTTHVWLGCDHRMRQLANYAGLRNRVGLLIRANAALPLAQRVAALSTTLRATLSGIARQREAILSHITAADSTVEAWGTDPGSSAQIPLRATIAQLGQMAPILVIPDSTASKHSRLHTVLMATQGPAAPAAFRRPPLAYVLPPDDSATARLLIRHGLVVQHHTGPQRVMIVERYIIDSMTPPPVRITGHWLRVIADTALLPGSYIVASAQPLDLVAMQLLEPESDDGLAAAHVYDHLLHVGGYYPIIRLLD